MQRKVTAFLSLAFGVAILVAPSLTNIGAGSAYDSAFAAKGGNGKGNGGKGGSQGNKGGKKHASGTVSNLGSAKKKISAKQLALTDPTAPAHPSMLGRWNAAKPIDHPAIQAHIRNGNYNGTIGMVAAYAQAQANYDSYQQSLATADPAAAALAAALTAADYQTVADYNKAVLDGEALANPAIDAALATTDVTTGVTTALTSDQISAAETLVDQGATAFSDLASAEANMEAWSNRSPWSEIRDDVRVKMGLDPLENDLVTTTSTDPVTTTP